MFYLSVHSSTSHILYVSLYYPFSSESEFNFFASLLPSWFYDKCLSYKSYSNSVFKFSVPIHFLNDHLPRTVLPVRFVSDLIIESLSQMIQSSSVY